MKYMMAKADAGSPMPPHARIPSYITAFQSSPVRIWWQEKPTRLCNDQTTCKMDASLCLNGRSLGDRLREIKNQTMWNYRSKSGRGCLQEVPNIVIWFGNFWYFDKVVIEEMYFLRSTEVTLIQRKSQKYFKINKKVGLQKDQEAPFATKFL